MTKYRALLGAAILLATSVVWLPRATGGRTEYAGPLPERLSNEAFWRLSSELSEPNGFFRSDNLLSNELWFQHVIPDLVSLTQPGGAYVGVGPEQNFTYIAAVRPRIAFIVDVRRGNLQLHLLYKALFELSDSRAAFVSRLFSRQPPESVPGHATAAQIFEAVSQAATTEETYAANLAAVRDHLTRVRGLPLGEPDLAGIDYVYRAFQRFGPAIQYRSTGGRGWRVHATYADLMTATDAAGNARSYLASDESFAVVQDLHARNLLVPIVGNFAGRRALRGVGQYLAGHGATVSAFYLSNVEQYLRQDGVWQEFCENAATLPIDGRSQFIRSTRNGAYGFGVSLNSELGTMLAETRGCR